MKYKNISYIQVTGSDTVRMNLSFGIEVSESGLSLRVGISRVVFSDETGVDTVKRRRGVENGFVVFQCESVSVFAESLATEFG